MTQEEKQLLFIDLSARLCHGVIVNYKEGEYDFHKWKIETLYAPEYSESGLLIETNCDGWIGYTDYKGCGMSCASRALHLDKNLPYLRPMSSMTEEERKELKSTTCPEGTGYFDEQYLICPMSHFGEHISYGFMSDILDWLNAHHFDYRGLIPMGLALEAPEGMYKTE